eukprot:tig00020746_g13677.t1
MEMLSKRAALALLRLRQGRLEIQGRPEESRLAAAEAAEALRGHRRLPVAGRVLVWCFAIQPLCTLAGVLFGLLDRGAPGPGAGPGAGLSRAWRTRLESALEDVLGDLKRGARTAPICGTPALYLEGRWHALRGSPGRSRRRWAEAAEAGRRTGMRLFEARARAALGGPEAAPHLAFLSGLADQIASSAPPPSLGLGPPLSPVSKSFRRDADPEPEPEPASASGAGMSLSLSLGSPPMSPAAWDGGRGPERDREDEGGTHLEGPLVVSDRPILPLSPDASAPHSPCRSPHAGAWLQL